jgi:membrane dipeptidase
MIIDAHLDLAFNAVGGGADLRLPLADLRRSAYGAAATARGTTPTVSLPALRAGDVRVVFGTIFVLKETPAFNVDGPTYTTAAEANVQGWAQLRYYQDLAQQGEIALVTDQQTLARALAGDAPQPGLVPLMEGADPIRDPDELGAWHEAGLRIIGLAWSATRYSGGTGAPGPLTPEGRTLVRAMREHRFALDVSHLSDESFWEALELFNGPVLASHANCRTFVPTDRQLSDDMIRAVVERGGVIGVIPYTKFLTHEWTPDLSRAPIDALMRHIEHICDLAGDTQHVGIGSDFDGGFGAEALPVGMESVGALPKIGDALKAQGWMDQDVAHVMSNNWARWLRGVLR